MEAKALELDAVVAGYGRVVVLRELTLSVDVGEIVAILGGNGAGKSTALKSICGLVKPRSGTIGLFGERIDGMPPHKIAKRNIGLASQGRQVFPKMTVLDNLKMGAYSRKDEDIDADFERVYDFFPRLKDRRKQSAGTMSGGEQQMLAIGRALMTRPKLMMLDEPSLGVAPIINEEIKRVIRKVRDEGVTVIVVEQNVDLAISVADRGYVLEMGHVAVEGSSDYLRTTDRVKAAYLGG